MHQSGTKMQAWIQDSAVDSAMENLECGEAWSLVGQAPSRGSAVLSVMLPVLHSQQSVPVTPSQGSAQVS